MANLTLLQIVTDMLSAIEAEDVTTVVSGSTTEEALMCVNIVNRTYESLIHRAKWKHLRTYKSLSAGGQLNELALGTNDLYVDAHNIWYGSSNDERRVMWRDPEDFINFTINRNTADSNIQEINNIKVYNDRDPSYFTSFDDNTLVFDAMPDGSGLVAGNSRALIYVEPTTRNTGNTDTYDLPRQLIPYFRDLCVANATIELAGDEIRGERLRQRANKEIAKIATSGKMVNNKDNMFKNITTRDTALHKQRRVIVI